MKKKIVIIGAGPAGLSCAYKLLKISKDVEVTLVEMDGNVGGIAKTIFDDGNGTDMGPHRFFTKNKEVLTLWNELLPFQGFPAIDDKLLNRDIDFVKGGANPEVSDNVFLKRKRFSRIYYNKHFLDYPIKFSLAIIWALGLSRTFVAGFSYLKACIHKIPETSLETFMINRFGRVLYELFFEGYTQKVWGVHPSLISKEWGIQRIKGISLIKVLRNSILTLLKLSKENEVSLIDEYYYPKLGSSQLWETMADEIRKMGGKILLNEKIESLMKTDGKITSVKLVNLKTGAVQSLSGNIFVSSLPIKELLTNLNDVPLEIFDIANNLVYRDFILVNFVTNKINLKNNTKVPTINGIAPDSWIYLQDSGVKAGRLDIMNNFSPYIINDFKKDVVINLEYFCNENDEIWNSTDEDIIKLATEELKSLKITDADNIKASKVLRIKKAYPSYFGSYNKFSALKEYINTIDNLYCIGRNGQHKYNNMDHSILSGLLAAQVIIKSSDKRGLWNVNTDMEYQETN